MSPQTSVLRERELRAALASELENTREEMSSLVAELNSARNDALVFAEKLVERDIALDELRAELAAAQEAAAASTAISTAATESAAREAAEIIAAQKRHIERLKKQLNRPMRALAKKALGRGHG